MRLSTPADSTAGVARESCDETTARTLDDSMLCACAMTSTFRDRAADDECKHECEHGKPFHDRRRRHGDPENRRLALAGIDGGGTALTLQDADVEQGHADQETDAEQTRRGCRDHRPIEAEHDDDAVDDDRGRQHRQSDIAPIAAVHFQDGAARGLSSLRAADCAARRLERPRAAPSWKWTAPHAAFPA